MLNAKSGHAVVANTLAMQAGGVTAETPDPEHGRIARDERGRPTGLLFEDAIAYVGRVKPRPELDELADLMVEAQRNLMARGITGVHDVDGNPAFGTVQIAQAPGTSEDSRGQVRPDRGAGWPSSRAVCAVAWATTSCGLAV